MAIMCGGGGTAFWVLKPGGGNSNPNAWRAPEGNCKGYKSNGYDGLLTAYLNGGNIASGWQWCPGGSPLPILFDPLQPDRPATIPGGGGVIDY